MITKITFTILAYLIGSTNFYIIASKLTKKQDPRFYGSKNAGATNIYRKTGIKFTVVILALDIIKAIFTEIAANHFMSTEYVPIACISLILGNRFPCFHNFNGGKGIANYLGFIIPISPITALIGINIWFLTIILLKVPFLASFLMILALFTGKILTTENNIPLLLEIIFTAVIIITAHRKNISQLTKKTNLNN